MMGCYFRAKMEKMIVKTDFTRGLRPKNQKKPLLKTLRPLRTPQGLLKTKKIQRDTTNVG